MTDTATAEQPEQPDAFELLADVSVWTADDWRRMAEAAASGATVDGLLRTPSPRAWRSEAQAAFDDALVYALRTSDIQSPDFWVARAQAAATIASAEQARIGNLIAWKQLRQSSPTSSLPLAGDAISDEIESALGIADGSGT